MMELTAHTLREAATRFDESRPVSGVPGLRSLVSGDFEIYFFWGFPSEVAARLKQPLNVPERMRNELCSVIGMPLGVAEGQSVV